MNRIRGSRGKSRHKFRKGPREKGKLRISKFIQCFEHGQKVHLSLESSYHKGLFHQRFQGKTGTVIASRGRCYEVVIKDGGKEKMIIVHPVHLQSKG